MIFSLQSTLSRYRCAVVTKIDDSTSKELLQFTKIGYGAESEAQSPSVLALVEDTDDVLFQEFRSQVVEPASKLPRTNLNSARKIRSMNLKNMTMIMIMKENPKYTSGAVERKLDLVSGHELTLLKCISVLDLCTHKPGVCHLLRYLYGIV